VGGGARSVKVKMTPDSPETFGTVRLVLGIARLGERDLRGWWQEDVRIVVELRRRSPGLMVRR
jgi:hypothetical protein